MKEKRGIIWDSTLGILVAVAVLILGIFAYMILTGKVEGAIDYLKNFLRFGR